MFDIFFTSKNIKHYLFIELDKLSPAVCSRSENEEIITTRKRTTLKNRSSSLSIKPTKIHALNALNHTVPTDFFLG
jgi:hypothetical protein